MHTKTRLALCLIAALAATAAQARHHHPVAHAKHAVRRVGHDLHNGVRSVGHGIHHAVRKVEGKA